MINASEFTISQKLQSSISKNKLFKIDEMRKSSKKTTESLIKKTRKAFTGLEYSNGYWMCLPLKTKAMDVFDFTHQNESVSEILAKSYTDFIPKYSHEKNNRKVQINDETKNLLTSNRRLQKELSIENTTSFVKNEQTKAPVSYYRVNKFFVLNKKLDNLNTFVYNSHAENTTEL